MNFNVILNNAEYLDGQKTYKDQLALLEQFSIDYRLTKTKVISTASHNKDQHHYKPIKTQS